MPGKRKGGNLNVGTGRRSGTEKAVQQTTQRGTKRADNTASAGPRKGGRRK